MTGFSIFILLSLVSLGVAVLSAIGNPSLHRLDAQARIPVPRLAIAGAVGGAVVLGAGLFAGVQDFTLLLLAGLLGVFAAMLALMDRDTAWAPDEFTMPFAVLAILVGDRIGGWGLGWIISTFAGLGLFAFGWALWWIQDRLEMQVLPPPDCLAIVAPLPLLGMSMALPAHFLAISAILIGCRVYPPAVRVFAHPDAVSAAQTDLGYDRPAITFLAVAMPVLILAVAGRLAFGLL